MSQKLQNKWDMKKHRQYKGVMVQCLMSQKLGVILPPAAAPQLLAGEKHNSQWSGQIDLSPLQGFHGQAVGKPLQRGEKASIPVSRLKKERYQIGIVLFFRALPGLESSMSTLRSGPRSPRSPGPRAPSRASFICSGSLDFTGFPLFLCLHEIVDSWFYNECG